MISEAKACAALSAGLLARKGAARPAMQRLPVGGLGLGLGLGVPDGAGVRQDDLGWDDMGYDVDPAVGLDVGSRGAAVDLQLVTAVRAKDKAALTLWLDAERHLALRLASAVSNQSSQAIMTRLLDDYLASVPEIGDLAGHVPAMPPARKGAAR